MLYNKMTDGPRGYGDVTSSALGFFSNRMPVMLR